MSYKKLKPISHARTYFTMLAIRSLVLVPVAVVATSVFAQVVHYPPTLSNINNLTFALNGSGAPGIFNSSVTPENEYGITYNWCNMPHVRTQEYKYVHRVLRRETTLEPFCSFRYIRTPPNNYTLQYVEIIQRHHKRTPYASNTFFKEDIAWSCVGEGPVYAVTRWEIFIIKDNSYWKLVGSEARSLAQTFLPYR